MMSLQKSPIEQEIAYRRRKVNHELRSMLVNGVYVKAPLISNIIFSYTTNGETTSESPKGITDAFAQNNKANPAKAGYTRQFQKNAYDLIAMSKTTSLQMYINQALFTLILNGVEVPSVTRLPYYAETADTLTVQKIRDKNKGGESKYKDISSVPIADRSSEQQKLERRLADVDAQMRELAYFLKNNTAEKGLAVVNWQTNTADVVATAGRRPFLISYAWLAHKFLARNVFLDEFIATCSAYVEPAQARACDKVYYDASTVDVPYTPEEATALRWGTPREISWPDHPTVKDSEDTPLPYNDHTFYGSNAVVARRNQWLDILNERTHIITRAVDPLICALLINADATIEFVSADANSPYDRTVQVQLLREHINNGGWTGVVRSEEDPKLTNLLTYVVLVLVGSSSGVPLYASRNWLVVRKLWNDMVKEARQECWLARYVDENLEEIEVHERRFLELVVQMIATTHVSDEEVKRFKPGALGYASYARKYYDRMVKNDVLGRVRTQAYLTTSADVVPDVSAPIVAGEAKTAGATPSGETKTGQIFFPQRLRFEEEFSYPRDLDDLIDAARMRLNHWTEANVRFV